MVNDLVRISDGNLKLGKIPNISLVTAKDCGNCTLCSKDCYAIKPFKRTPQVRVAWSTNSAIARNNRDAYFKQVQRWLEKNRPKFFRWHIGGDILDQYYLNSMHNIALALPNTNFLCFTKMHHLDFTDLAPNLAVIASMWPGLEPHENVKHLPKAWMQDGTETRVPESAIPCPGSCETCGMCWALPKLGVDVVFMKH